MIRLPAPRRAFAVLLALGFCLGLVALSPAALAANTSCSVSASTPSCSFTCDPGSTITVSGSGEVGAVEGSCGSPPLVCPFTPVSGCIGTSSPSTGGTGTCSLEGIGAGSCGASSPSSGDGHVGAGSGHKGPGHGHGHGKPGARGANSLCPATSQPTHTYGPTLAPGIGSTTLQEQGSPASGVDTGLVTVEDTNVADCDGDGVPNDFDGDYDLGIGGGFFGSSNLWDVTDDCGYDLNVHATTGTATDVTGLAVRGLYGVDDAEGPAVVVDPTSGASLGCQTDGSITPATDANDCLSAWTGSWSSGACPASGGDDGYWLFLEVQSAETHGAITLGGATSGTLAADA